MSKLDSTIQNLTNLLLKMDAKLDKTFEKMDKQFDELLAKIRPLGNSKDDGRSVFTADDGRSAADVNEPQHHVSIDSDRVLVGGTKTVLQNMSNELFVVDRLVQDALSKQLEVHHIALPEEVVTTLEGDRYMVDDLCRTTMSVGNSKELIDENHAIVSSPVSPKYYDGILSFVDKDQVEHGCSILMHDTVLSVVGLLLDEVGLPGEFLQMAATLKIQVCALTIDQCISTVRENVYENKLIGFEAYSIIPPTKPPDAVTNEFNVLNTAGRTDKGSYEASIHFGSLHVPYHEDSGAQVIWKSMSYVPLSGGVFLAVDGKIPRLPLKVMEKTPGIMHNSKCLIQIRAPFYPKFENEKSDRQVRTKMVDLVSKGFARSLIHFQKLHSNLMLISLLSVVCQKEKFEDILDIGEVKNVVDMHSDVEMEEVVEKFIGNSADDERVILESMLRGRMNRKKANNSTLLCCFQLSTFLPQYTAISDATLLNEFFLQYMLIYSTRGSYPSKEEFAPFYERLISDWEERPEVSNFFMEGQLVFRATLVFIRDNGDERIPDYLCFVNVIVDYMPLYIAREIFQPNKSLKVFGKDWVQKCIELFEEFAESFARFFLPALDYETTRFLRSSGALGHVVIVEIKVANDTNGGLVVLAESFGQTVFKYSITRVFHSTIHDLDPAMNDIFEKNCSKDSKILGILSPCASVEKEFCSDAIPYSRRWVVDPSSVEDFTSGFDHEAPVLMTFLVISTIDTEGILWLSNAKVNAWLYDYAHFHMFRDKVQAMMIESTAHVRGLVIVEVEKVLISAHMAANNQITFEDLLIRIQISHIWAGAENFFIARRYIIHESGFSQLQRMRLCLFISVLAMLVAAATNILPLHIMKFLVLSDQDVAVPLTRTWQIAQHSAWELLTLLSKSLNSMSNSFIPLRACAGRYHFFLLWPIIRAQGMEDGLDMTSTCLLL